VDRLHTLLRRVRPDTVVTFGPDGFTGHPDHRAVSTWVDLALERHDEPVRLLHPVVDEVMPDTALDDELGVYELGRPRVIRDGELALRVHLEGPALARKVSALLAQESQTAGAVQHAGRDRFAAWVATEHFAHPRR
jgi:LmbE family N-acetylglucosaminyl deacetylase